MIRKGWTAQRVRVSDDVSLHVVTAGPPTNAHCIVLLHGFPEFWFAWRNLIDPLAAAGFRVIAPDLRGYNLSDKPAGVAAYAMERLVRDVVGLIDALGCGRATLVGHDWGGIIAWCTAMWRPEVVERLVSLNAPHPAIYQREVRRPPQALLSWYAGLFQLPRLPEAVIASGGSFRSVRRLFRTDPLRPLPADDIDAYVDALRQPGALTAALNYYRAAFRQFGRLAPAARSIRCPTLVVHGERDRYLSNRLLIGLERWVERLQLERLPGLTHWVHHDRPDLVIQLLLRHLRTDAHV